jgi:hypothetical protein
MMFVQIEGSLDELRGLQRVEGLRLQRGAHDLGGGRWRASAYLTSKTTLAEVQARGLTVRVTMDEDEVNRRVQVDKEMMKEAHRDGGAAKAGKDQDGGTPGSRKP